MKILVDGLPRKMGGIGTLVMNMVECAKGDEVTFEFIVPKDSKYIEVLKSKGMKYYCAPNVHEIFKYRRFVKRLFESRTFDYLWFNNTSKVNMFLPSYANKCGTKVIAHAHGVDFEEKGVKRVVFKALDAVNSWRMFSLISIPLACSDASADFYYKKDTGLRKKVTILKNGISTSAYSFDVNKRNELRKEMNLGEDEVLIGTVGRLTAVKNIPFMVQIIRELDSKYRLLVVGDGEERERIQLLAADMGVDDRCYFVGARKNVPDYLSAMDCFLLPSVKEGMPFSVIEAQSEGLPCFVSSTLTREIGITQLVEFLPIDSPTEWAKAISKASFDRDRSEFPLLVKKAGYSIENTYSVFRSLCEAIE